MSKAKKILLDSVNKILNKLLKILKANKITGFNRKEKKKVRQKTIKSHIINIVSLYPHNQTILKMILKKRLYYQKYKKQTFKKNYNL